MKRSVRRVLAIGVSGIAMVPVLGMAATVPGKLQQDSSAVADVALDLEWLCCITPEGCICLIT